MFDTYSLHTQKPFRQTSADKTVGHKYTLIVFARQ